MARPARCGYCGAAIEQPKRGLRRWCDQRCRYRVDPEDFHVDHVRPLAAGGEHSYANVQAAHPDCNLRKGARV